MDLGDVVSVVTLAGVVFGGGSAYQQLKDLRGDMKAVKSRIFNGHFVPRSECLHCKLKPEEEEEA